MSVIFDKPLTGYRYVDIQHGDTLRAIAARELGDASRWVELIAYNSLVPPYVAEAPSPGVLAYGAQILVPAPTRIISTTADPDRVFEIDIDLSKGHLEAEDGDFALVSGRANLRQALKHRVETDRGELVYHGNYGSFVRRLIGAVNGPTSALLAAEYAKSAIQADPRISSVTQATAEVVGDKISVSVEAQPISGRTVHVEAAP